jgi:hypothetical protein
MPGGNIRNAKDDNEESRMGTATGREDLHPRFSGRVRPLLGHVAPVPGERRPSARRRQAARVRCDYLPNPLRLPFSVPVRLTPTSDEWQASGQFTTITRDSCMVTSSVDFTDKWEASGLFTNIMLDTIRCSGTLTGNLHV